MEAIVTNNAKVLVPNKEHKNFTETSQVIPKGTTVKGEYKSIAGLRRGKPFSYRVFVTENGEIIYSNNITEMRSTEVTLGADSSQTPTRIDMLPAETFKATRILVALAGAVGGYYYAKKKGKSSGAAIKYSVVGAIAGYAAVWAFDRTKSVTVKSSK